MIDKSLFPRLKRLFTTDVIIRNVGGNELRVADVDSIQSYGKLQTNSAIDRFTRMYRTGQRTQWNPALNYETLRSQLYYDYEAMDTDGIISAALDVISEESTMKDETDEVLGITSTNENIQRILYNLFYDILNIEFNLPMWIRSMCKYGDLFLHLDITQEYGVTNAKPISVYDMRREEGQDPNNDSYIRFIYDPMLIAGGTYSSPKDKKVFENYEIVHFRYITDTNYLPFGRSYLEPARKYYKQYTLMLDAMMLHRIMRAPERRVFYIDVGALPPNEVDAEMQRVMTQMKKTPYLDHKTGDYNLKFNVQNMLEDFAIPVRGDKQGTRIDTTKGLEYTGIEDVEFLRDLMLAALKVPKAFLNFSDELNGKSTISALDLRFARTIDRIQRLVLSELKKIAIIHLYVQGFEDADLLNFKLSLTKSSILFEQEKIALLKEKTDLAIQIKEARLKSSDWISANIYEESIDELNIERDLIIEDAKRDFRIAQIEKEGNDPSLSGVSYGTPHDLASLNQATDTDVPGDADEPIGYDEKNPVGRPKEKSSIYSTDKAIGGRDPLGKSGIQPEGGKTKKDIVVPAMKLEGLSKYKGKKVSVIYENKIDNNIKKGSILDESRLM